VSRRPRRSRAWRLAPTLLLALVFNMVSVVAPVRAVAPIANAHWTFDEGSGNVVGDSSPNGNTGTATDITWVEGIEGSAVHAGDGVVTVPDAASLRPSKPSIALWVRSASAPDPIETILDHARGACVSAYGLNATTQGFYFTLHHGTWSNIVSVQQAPDGGTIWDGEWHHIALVQDPGMVHLHLDGVEVDYDGMSGAEPISYGTGGDVSIGGDPACAFRESFAGDIDDVRLYASPFLVEDVAPALAAMETQTAVQMTLNRASVYSGLNANASITVSPSPGGGRVALERWDGTAWSTLTTAAIDYYGEAYVPVGTGQLALGANQLRARYLGEGKYLASPPSPEKTLTRVKQPTTTVLAVSPTYAVAYQPFTLTAGVQGNATSGTIDFYRVIPGRMVRIGSDSIVGGAKITVPGRSPGEYGYVARFSGSADVAGSQSPIATQIVEKVPTFATVTVNEPEVQAHHAAGIQVLLDSTAVPGVKIGGSWTLRDSFNGVTTTLASFTTDSSAHAFETSDLAVGSHYLTAVYSGDNVFSASTSATVKQVIVADRVDVSDLGLNYATFYPVMDDYRDVVNVKGTLAEPATVAIRIKNAAGTAIRSFDRSFEPGPYAQPWNGRNTAGTLQPAGTYYVTQTITDAYKNKVTWSGKVILSKKKLVEKSGSVTYYADQYKAKTVAGSASSATTTTKYTRGMKVKSGAGIESVGALGYAFTLPSAPVYVSMKFSALGSGGPGFIALHDFREGSWPSGGAWIIDYFTPVKQTGTGYAWHGTYGNVSYHRDGRTVHAMVKGGPDYFYIAKVKLSYTIKVLE